jgi:hypothetical protein
VSRRLLVMLLLAAVVGAWAAATAAAADARQGTARTSQAGPAVELRLRSVAPVVGPRTPLSYRLSVSNPGTVELHGLRVQALLGAPIRTRSELQRLADNADATPDGLRQLDSWRPQDGAATVAPGRSLTLEPQSEPLPAWLEVPTPGMVLPLVLQVGAASERGEVSSHITTFVVAVNGKVEQPLRLALLVPLHERSHRNPAGDFIDDRLGSQLAGNGSLGAIAAELARPGAPKVSMVIDPLLIDEATAMGGGWKLRRGTRVTTVPAGDPSSQAGGRPQPAEHLPLRQRRPARAGAGRLRRRRTGLAALCQAAPEGMAWARPEHLARLARAGRDRRRHPQGA